MHFQMPNIMISSRVFPLMKPQIMAHTLTTYSFHNPDAQRTVIGQTWRINFRKWRHHRLMARTPEICQEGAHRGVLWLLTATLEEHRNTGEASADLQA